MSVRLKCTQCKKQTAHRYKRKEKTWPGGSKSEDPETVFTMRCTVCDKIYK